MELQKTKYIAVIRLSAMGDVAMTVPVILALIQQHPNLKITLVSRAFFKPIFKSIPQVHFHEVHTHHQHKGFLGLFKLYREFKTQKIDAVADLHNVLRSKIIKMLFALTGKKTATIDKGRDQRKALTRLENKEIKPLPSVFSRYAATFAKLGYSIDMGQSYFLPKQQLPKAVVEITGNKTEKWIGIAPFAHYESKTYPLDLMQNVIDELVKTENVKIMLLGGGKHQAQLLDTLKGNHQNIYNFANNISFEEELHLISNLDVMLSMDSGNAHLAAMYGVETITLWGATHPYSGFAPYNQPIENCIVSSREQYPFLPTSIYGNKKVKGYEEAMRSISSETVVSKIKLLL